MSRSADFERFVPDVASVAAWVGPANSQEPMVAILVDATVVVRSSWTDDVEVSEKLFEALREAKPPSPSFEKIAQFRVLTAESRQARVRKCGACFALPGQQLCTICGGTGQVGTGDQLEPCTSCSGGKLTCTTCDGTLKSVRVRIEFGEDQVRHMPHIFVSGVSGDTRQRLQSFFRSRPVIPEELAIDLAEDFARSDAYRGRRGTDEIWGFAAGPSLSQARVYLERLDKLPTVAAVKSAVFAWPYEVLATDLNTVVCIADETGKTHVLG